MEASVITFGKLAGYALVDFRGALQLRGIAHERLDDGGGEVLEIAERGEYEACQIGGEPVWPIPT